MDFRKFTIPEIIEVPTPENFEVVGTVHWRNLIDSEFTGTLRGSKTPSAKWSSQSPGENLPNPKKEGGNKIRVMMLAFQQLVNQ